MADRALQLDSLSLAIHNDVAFTFYYARQYDRVAEEANKMLELDHNSVHGHGWLGAAYLKKGQYEQAIPELQKAVDPRSGSTSFAHDFYTNVIHRGTEREPGEEVRVARVTAFVVGAVAMAVAILLGPNANVAFLVALAFAVAASANLPVIVLSLFWKRFTTRGAVCGLGTGLVASILLIIIGPSIMGVDAPGATTAAHLIQSPPIFPLENPGLVSNPLGFVGAILGTLLGREPGAAAKYDELLVRASTGLGAEKASGH